MAHPSGYSPTRAVPSDATYHDNSECYIVNNNKTKYDHEDNDEVIYKKIQSYDRKAERVEGQDGLDGRQRVHAPYLEVKKIDYSLHSNKSSNYALEDDRAAAYSSKQAYSLNNGSKGKEKIEYDVQYESKNSSRLEKDYKDEDVVEYISKEECAGDEETEAITPEKPRYAQQHTRRWASAFSPIVHEESGEVEGHSIADEGRHSTNGSGQELSDDEIEDNINLDERQRMSHRERLGIRRPIRSGQRGSSRHEPATRVGAAVPGGQEVSDGSEEPQVKESIVGEDNNNETRGYSKPSGGEGRGISRPTRHSSPMEDSRGGEDLARESGSDGRGRRESDSGDRHGASPSTSSSALPDDPRRSGSGPNPLEVHQGKKDRVEGAAKYPHDASTKSGYTNPTPKVAQNDHPTQGSVSYPSAQGSVDYSPARGPVGRPQVQGSVGNPSGKSPQKDSANDDSLIAQQIDANTDDQSPASKLNAPVSSALGPGLSDTNLNLSLLSLVSSDPPLSVTNSNLAPQILKRHNKIDYDDWYSDGSYHATSHTKHIRHQSHNKPHYQGNRGHFYHHKSHRKMN